MRLIGFAIYLGIGAMMHALFIGSQFDWSSAWTFGWLLGWPIMIVFASWAVIAGLVICVICLGLGIAIWEGTEDWRLRRTINRTLKRARANAARPATKKEGGQ